MVTHAIDRGVPTMAAATVMSAAGLASFSGKIVCGIFADRGLNVLSWNWLPLLPMLVVYFVSGVAEMPPPRTCWRKTTSLSDSVPGMLCAAPRTPPTAGPGSPARGPASTRISAGSPRSPHSHASSSWRWRRRDPRREQGPPAGLWGTAALLAVAAALPVAAARLPTRRV